MVTIQVSIVAIQAVIASRRRSNPEINNEKWIASGFTLAMTVSNSDFGTE